LVLLGVGAAQDGKAEESLLEAGRGQGSVRRVIAPQFREVMGFGELKQMSDVVLRGRVVEEAVFLSEGGQTIWTDYTIEVLEDLTGRGADLSPASRLLVREEGGNLVLESISISVSNDFFPPLPWVREHVFFLYRDSGQAERYRFRGGPMGVYRREESRLRCHLPRAHWGWLCRQRDGSSWEEMVDYVRRTGRR
jgi:hypothetical protein